MQLHVTPGDGAPIYRQIIDQVKHLVAAGRLKPGDEMPPIRGLAQQLLINPNTVARAYRALGQRGAIRVVWRVSPLAHFFLPCRAAS